MIPPIGRRVKPLGRWAADAEHLYKPYFLYFNTAVGQHLTEADEEVRKSRSGLSPPTPCYLVSPRIAHANPTPSNNTMTDGMAANSKMSGTSCGSELCVGSDVSWSPI
jgi:hypothetical protein